MPRLLPLVVLLIGSALACTATPQRMFYGLLPIDARYRVPCDKLTKATERLIEHSGAAWAETYTETGTPERARHDFARTLLDAGFIRQWERQTGPDSWAQSFIGITAEVRGSVVAVEYKRHPGYTRIAVNGR